MSAAELDLPAVADPLAAVRAAVDRARAERAAVPGPRLVVGDDPRIAAVEWSRGLDCPYATRAAEAAYEKWLGRS